MKTNRFFGLLLVLFLALSPLAFAGKASEDGVGEGQFHDLNITTGLDVSVDGGVATLSTELLNNGRGAAASLSLASSTTAISDSTLPYSVILKNVGGGGGLDSTGIGSTLPDAPVDGQSLSIIITGLQSGGSWVVTPTTKTGFTNITFDTKGDTATLLYVNDTIGWIIAANGGATITQA